MTIGKRFASALGCALMVAAMAGYASAAGYTQTNLVSNGPVTAAHTYPNLINPWGISFFPGSSPFWVSDNNAGVATLYDGTGLPNPLIVDIPSPTDPTHGGATGAPTGQVANLSLFTSPSFPIFQNGSFAGLALFIFATEDGTIEAWNSLPFTPPGITDPDGPLPFSDDAVIVVDNSPGGAVYKGLALADRR